MPSLLHCGMRLNSPDGQGQCHIQKLWNNIGEGILTIPRVSAYSTKHAVLSNCRKKGARQNVVYVISNKNEPLMPTDRHGKVRKLLREHKAIVVQRCPFTIKLLYESGCVVQPLTLGMDTGSKNIGISVTSQTREYYAEECILRNDIVELMSTRRILRRSRRIRKTRYRQARFLNRGKRKGWLTPSVRNKIESHIRRIENVCAILPIKKIVIETASFDIQRIKNKNISQEEYQHGEQFGFWNVREYVLYRDHHRCQCCGGSSGDRVLNVHHIESRKTGGNSPDNLVTLCKTCHVGYHEGSVALPEKIKRGRSFRNETAMSVVRSVLYKNLKEKYEKKAIPVCSTYGYITKYMRAIHNLEKTHAVDARCISGNPQAKAMDCLYVSKKVRCHNRKIHKLNTGKNGERKRNTAQYIVKGFRRFDKVFYRGKECFVFGRRNSGRFDLRLVDGTVIARNASAKEMRLLDTTKKYIMERRNRLLTI